MQTFLEQFGTLAQGEFEHFKSQTTTHHVQRDHYLLQVGQVCEQVFFIKRGCVQLTGVNDDGTEFGIKIAVENKFITDCESLFTQLPSRCNIRAIEDSVVTALSPKLTDAHSPHPSIRKVVRLLLDHLVADYQLRISSLLSDNAHDRFRFFLANESELLYRLQWDMVANYLRIPLPTFLRLEKTLNGRK